MTKDGKLSKRDMATLDKAWEILSRWSEWAEKDAEAHGYEAETDYAYNSAMNAVVGLCEFIKECKEA